MGIGGGADKGRDSRDSYVSFWNALDLYRKGSSPILPFTGIRNLRVLGENDINGACRTERSGLSISFKASVGRKAEYKSFSERTKIGVPDVRVYGRGGGEWSFRTPNTHFPKVCAVHAGVALEVHACLLRGNES
jgi:hypothetical protein